MAIFEAFEHAFWKFSFVKSLPLNVYNVSIPIDEKKVFKKASKLRFLWKFVPE